MKKMTSIYLSAAATAIALVAVPAQAVVIDFNGTGGATMSTFDVTKLNWLPDNVLAVGALSTPRLTVVGGGASGQRVGESYFQTVAQGKLGTVGTTTTNPFSLQSPFGYFFATHAITFQASFYEFANGIGASTSSFRLAPGENYFKIFAQSNDVSSTITGNGYGAGAGATLIYSGTLASVSGAYTDKTMTVGDDNFGKTPLLDSSSAINGGDQQQGVLTHVGQGLNTILVTTTYLNPKYFVGDVNSIALALTYNDADGLTDPFFNAHPSDHILGFTPSYSNVSGKAINGGTCSPTLTDAEILVPNGITEDKTFAPRCDFHFQSLATGTFNTNVPEPSTLALLGVALLGLSASVRRKKN